MAQVIETRGDLLEAKVEALVNAVNTVGVMGKGIALRFRETFPENYARYRAAAKRGEIVPGRMFVTENPGSALPRYIVNFPTKRDWRSKSKQEDIETGLVALVETLREKEIGSVAIPALGCGNGGLAWATIHPIIVQSLADLPDSVRVLLYPPDEGTP